MFQPRSQAASAPSVHALKDRPPANLQPGHMVPGGGYPPANLPPGHMVPDGGYIDHQNVEDGVYHYIKDSDVVNLAPPAATSHPAPSPLHHQVNRANGYEAPQHMQYDVSRSQGYEAPMKY